ncbi:hypothetical protein PISMIDRAFT_22752 [Pisolithus microcarpus 441]|uniref:DNA 3'-5' helicase n=1 Tax=Pisolithus microcarpus 441 TaxID=765257 RepID=A0A0C9ZTN3_9AGAM|nr:hypothetical protein PISMIDRAFT_22752 [Pisolithus microcarpus 441]
MITVKKNEQGLFDCFCSHKGCPGKKGFTTVEGLKKHMHKLKSTWIGLAKMGTGHINLTTTHEAQKNNKAADGQHYTITAPQQAMSGQQQTEDSSSSAMGAWQDDETEDSPMQGDEQQGKQANDPNPISEVTSSMESGQAVFDPRDELVHHPYLDTVNLVVDPQLQALCCNQCQVALIPRQALAHIHGQHKGLQPNREHLNAVLAQLDILPDLPEASFDTVIPPFKGLRILDGLACGNCSFVTSSAKYMQMHHREHHRSTPMPKSWVDCKMQQFSRSGKGHILFQVQDSTTPIHIGAMTDTILLLRQEMAQVTTSSVPEDEHVISPWLRTTRWHEHVAGHDTSMLLRLVEIPRSDDDMLLPGLKAAVGLYFDEALALLQVTDELVLQRLNSPDPLKSGINNTPFHRHQNEETMGRYSLPVMALIWMLVRVQHEDRYSLPLPDTLIAKLAALRQGLHDGVNVSCSIHEVLTEVWMSKWIKTFDNPLPCPTERMLALFTLDRDGKHKEPNSVTWHLAKLEYCIRLVSLKELKLQAASKFNQDDELACDAVQPYFTEHTNTPFGRIRALQHCASALAFQTMSLPCIWWINNKQWTELLYKGHRINLNGLQTMFAASATAVTDLWEKKVLRGIKIHVSYQTLAEDLGNRDVGYSFLTDRRNTCFADRDLLGNKFLTDLSVSGQFGVWRDGRMIWDKGTLMQWLDDYADFQGQLLLRCETLSVILGRHVALLHCYHKSAAMTGHEKLIPHALDALTGDLLVQSLALARPFAELAIHFAEELMEMDENDTVDALQAGHSRATENRIYGLSPEALPGAAEDIIPLFLQASVRWQLIMHTIPGGLELGYTYTNPAQFQELARSGQLGLDAQQEVTGSRENNGSVDRIADQVVAKLEEKFIGNLEARLTDRLVASLGPAIQTITKDAVQVAMAGTAPNPPGNRATPTNATGWEEMYVDPVLPPPTTEDNQVTPRGKKAAHDGEDDAENAQETHRLGDIWQRLQGQSKLSLQHDTRPATQVEEPCHPCSDAILAPNLEQQCLQALKQALKNPTATWTSPYQRDAVLAVAQKRTDVIAMLKTGGGKSMLAIIPAILKPAEAIVVILPLKSSMTDWRQKLDDMGIPYQEYTHGQLRADTNLILMSADRSMFAGCQQALAKLNEEMRVTRLIFDEAHLVLLSKSFQSSLRNVAEL